MPRYNIILRILNFRNKSYIKIWLIYIRLNIHLLSFYIIAKSSRLYRSIIDNYYL
jgi:hypothetical protein